MVEYGSIWFNGIVLLDIATDIELKGFTTPGKVGFSHPMWDAWTRRAIYSN